MSEATLIRDLAVVLVVSAAVTTLFHRLRQPVVLGYLLAGVIIGPHTPPLALVRDQHSIHTLGELGVIFLLFSLGLEFSLRKLGRVGLVAVVGAGLEIPLMIWLGYSLGRLLGWSTMDSVFLGAILSISSTTIIVKALEGLRLLHRESSRIIMGILIVEDLGAIVILVLLSGLARAGTVDPMAVLIALGAVALFVTCVVVLGLLVVPRMLHALASTAVPEVLTITVLALCLGTAVLAGAFGFSVALGAFLMGAVVAESRQVKLITERMEPIRDMFSAVFFVAIGLAIDPALLATHWGAILAIVLVVIGGKVVSAGFGALLVGYPPRVALRVGMGLAQIGEFSFIIANLGLATGVMSPMLYPVTVGVSAVTTLLTPYLIRAAGPLGDTLEQRGPRLLRSYHDFLASRARRRRGVELASAALRPDARRALLYGTLLAATVIGTGQAALRLAERGPRSLVFEDDVQVILWTGCAVVSLPLVAGLARAVSQLASTIAEAAVRPEGRAFVRDMLRFGFAVGGGAVFLALGSPVLPRGLPLAITLFVVGVAGAVLWRSAAELRDRAEETLRSVLGNATGGDATAPARESLAELAAHKYPFQVVLEEAVLPFAASAANARLRDLQIRSRTGATVAAIVRDTESVVNPDPDTRLEPGDVLVVMGSREQVARALRYLRELGSRPPAPPTSEA